MRMRGTTLKPASACKLKCADDERVSPLYRGCGKEGSKDEKKEFNKWYQQWWDENKGVPAAELATEVSPTYEENTKCCVPLLS